MARTFFPDWFASSTILMSDVFKLVGSNIVKLSGDDIDVEFQFLNMFVDESNVPNESNNE